MTARASVVRGVLRADAGRTRLMVAAIAVGVSAAGAILGALTVIDRTITDDFASTRPPAATLTLAADATAWEPAAMGVAGVTAAEARREVTVRMASAEGWQRLTLVAVADPDSWSVGRAFPESGVWPPGRGEIVVERASLTAVEMTVGDTLTAETVAGSEPLKVVGLGYDPGRTPAWMFGTVVGFVTPETLRDVGVDGGLTALSVRTADGSTREENRAVADAVADAVTRAGGTVLGTTVPEPGEHPARGVMTTLLYLLQVFGLVALLAATALVTTLVVAEVKRSTGAIAVMKSGGATSRQIAGIFVAALLVIAGIGLALGLVGGAAGTWALSTFAFTLLNLDATSMVATWWVFPVQAVVALVVPAVAVAVPLWTLSRRPVAEGLSAGETAPARAPRRTREAPRFGRAAQLGVRNAFRQPGRLTLTAAALAVGAAATMSALNTGAAWDRIVGEEFMAQDFDVQLQLASPIAVGSLDSAIVPGGLSRVEYWNVAEAAVTGPDGAIGDVATVLSAPSDSASATFPLLTGRQLAPGDTHSAVISTTLKNPSAGVGDRIRLGGDPAAWTVVGVVRQLSGGDSGVVWVSKPLATMPQGAATAIRVTGQGEAEALAAAERALDAAGVGIVSAVTATDAKESLDDHLYIITGLLLVMSLGLGAVGLLGLVEAMSTAIAERRREIALLKTVGAGISALTRMVVVEAVVTALLALAAGILLTVPLTALVENAVGTIFVGSPLPYTWWPPGALIAAVVMTGAAAVASVVPTFEAADLPVREVLAYG